MNHATLIDAVVEYTEMSKKDAREVVDAVVDAIADGLGEDGEVAVSRLGKFRLKERAARRGHNPQTGESIDIAAKTVVTFKPAAVLAGAMNE